MSGIFNRRELLRRSSAALTLPAFLRAAPARAAAAVQQGLRPGKDIYRSIGVRPLVNARGTFTIISGSVMLPEVRAAMAEAAQQYVHLDELMAGIGARLAELTKAEWGMVASGCAAAITHATAACVAGGNPDLHVRIPNLAGFAKDEVVIPAHSRNVYDAAVRAVGVRIIEVGTVAELEAAIGPRTAMIYILAGPNADQSPLNTKAIAQVANPKGVPILVDAAAEVLTIPNVHLQAGATLVTYSGGKCMRGPQSAGMLLGRKDLVSAAWVHSAPHHGFARSMKVGKEEAIGMLMAVEMWVKRDHKAEWRQWLAWLNTIAAHASKIDGVTTSVFETTELSNQTPTLTLKWDRTRIGISGAEVAAQLLNGEPRVATNGGQDSGNQAALVITPYMMMPGDEAVVAQRVAAVLSSAPKPQPARPLAAPAADLSGQWDVQIDYAAGSAAHTLFVKQTGNRLEGSHQGNFVSRDLSGTIDGSAVQIASAYTDKHGDSLNYTFTGTIAGNEMSGTIGMGEYLQAKWKARRHEYLR